MILIVSAIPHFAGISPHPEPKNIIIAAEVEFLTAQTGNGTLDAQPFGTFKSQPGVERDQSARHRNGSVFGGKVSNHLAVPIDARGDLFECRLSRTCPLLRRRSLFAFEYVFQGIQGSATCQTEAHQQYRQEF